MKELLTAKANIDRFLGTEEVHEEPDATKEKVLKKAMEILKEVIQL